MGKGYALLSVLILLTTIPLSVVCVQPVKAQTLTAITINGNGTVTPSTAAIKQTGNIYTLTGNINGYITIVKSNIVLNGNAYSVSVPLALASTGSIIALNDVSNVSVTNVAVTGGQFGISVMGVGNLIKNNTVTKSGTIYVWNGADTAGIYVKGGNSNSITDNILENNMVGIGFTDTSDNLIVGNSGDVFFYDASNNTVYHNNFENAKSFNSINYWDDGFPSGGNYWGQQNGEEMDGTGISDTPYVIDSQNKDRYPLVEPFNSSFLANYQEEIIPPAVSILSPSNKTYSSSSISLAFLIDKPFNWIGYSLDNQPNVTIVGNFSIVNMTYGSHNVTVYANSTFGILGASENVSFTIVQPFPIVTIAVISTIVGVAVAAGLLVYFKRQKR